MASSHLTRLVKIYTTRSGAMNNEHDRVARAELARRIARLGQATFVDNDPAPVSEPDGDARDTLFIPTGTIDLEMARQLGIRNESQIYGGVVPHGFVGSKVITHPVFPGSNEVPEGWRPELGAALAPYVLTGWSAFSVDAVREASLDMLRYGSIRLKEVEATAGLGQFVVTSPGELEEAIAQLDADAIARHGVVIEENLDNVITYSVGVTCLFGEIISYWGTQRLAANNEGATVYGGSTLHVVRGGFEQLAGLSLADDLQQGIEKAIAYDATVSKFYPDLMASRRNYDVAAGMNSSGEMRIGVLEQSWRAGGASGAEIAAFEAFARDRALSAVTCATMEIYGHLDAAPEGSILYYSGIDAVAGPITKYAMELE
ncbi:hypothetical protein CP98_04144 [Sphingobium yanoikuyae]|jgi:Protein of unknown function (DUF3182)|uniref:DUF3182 family protein n=1 Tax=Sphingobium yanoikuyae TaxID=13690 RepID=A0A084EER2_SPHYA|nr:DUF3182 family protein [Sphingobium yanoikuyae]KEZ16454.1 hypothetical protein CP98_04144 [Sphingobium yanoikuyae]QJR05825.1 DUF3182 family protein [Sphingobium yanoikuyae]